MSTAPTVGVVAATSSTLMPVDASGAMLLADCATGVTEHSGDAAMMRRRRRCVCDISELSMQNPAGCVLERLKLAPGRQYDRMKK
eukprot:2207177-Heterocapsa_arctica.AAC.1